jgi:hypothetical protein
LHCERVVPVGKREKVLQDVTGGRIEIGRRCGLQINVGKTEEVRISRQPSAIQVTTDQKQLNLQTPNVIYS